MPVEDGRPSGSRPRKDASPIPAIDIEAENARILEGVLGAMRRLDEPKVPDSTSLSPAESKLTTAYNNLAEGVADEIRIVLIAGRLQDGVGAPSHFAVAFQRIAKVLRPTRNGIAEKPDGARILYGIAPLKGVQASRLRYDMPIVEERRVRRALRAVVMPSVVTALSGILHDLARTTKDNGELVTTRHLFPDLKEQHLFLLEVLLAEVDDLFNPESPKSGRDIDLLRKLSGETAEGFKQEIRDHFSEEKREAEIRKRQKHGQIDDAEEEIQENL